MMNSTYIFCIISFLMVSTTSCQTPDSNATNTNTPTHKTTYICPPNPVISIYVQEEDITIYEKIILNTADYDRDTFDIQKLIIAIGHQLLTTPYVAHTLEREGEELLVINLQGMDCTTFVEYVMAIALSIMTNQKGFGDFARHLSCLRYREGLPDGYASRLHYFTEWLYNNQQKGIIEMTTDTLGTQPFHPEVFFMSQNPQNYSALSVPENLAQIKIIEQNISQYRTQFIPKEDIIRFEEQIKDGDIVSFVTNIKGLDISHTGFALHYQNRLHLLHASTRTHQVEITPVPLSDYLKPMSRVTGILVARVN